MQQDDACLAARRATYGPCADLCSPARWVN